jgi:hypothetical protein
MGRVVAARRRGRETAALTGGSLRTEEDPVKEETGADELTDNSITEEELLLAARRAFTFLSACVDGEIEDAKVADRIMAARGLLEHAEGAPSVRRPTNGCGGTERRRHRLDRHRVGVTGVR